MVAITTLTNAYLPQVHAGGSAAHETAPNGADKTEQAATPATVVTLSDQAQMLIAEAKAAQAVSDIFAIANGVAVSGENATQSEKTQVMIAHDLATNRGLYLLWARES